jgi:hypothetical protein
VKKGKSELVIQAHPIDKLRVEIILTLLLKNLDSKTISILGTNISYIFPRL